MNSDIFKNTFPIIKFIFILAALLLVVNLASIADDTEESFGVITEEEWALQPPPDDPDAGAVIIFDIGIKDSRPKDTKFIRHKRIKIFKKSVADDVAEIQIPKSKQSKLKPLKAHTITPSGEIIAVKEFFTKPIGESEFLVFTFPSIEDGSIIEYYYERKNYYSFSEWDYQNDLYTYKSRFTYYADYTPSYEVIFNNIAVFDRESVIKDSTDKDPEVPFFDMELTNLSAIKDEPLMGGRNDYTKSVSFDWKDAFEWTEFSFMIGKRIAQYYKSAIDYESQKVKKFTSSLCEGIQDRNKKARPIFEFVRDSIVINDNIEFSNKFSSLLKKREISSYSHNVLLVTMLRSQDIDAKLLFIGTREHFLGIHKKRFDILQFNRIICFIEDSTQSITLDAGDKYCPFPFIPQNDLVEQGFLLDAEECRVVDVNVVGRKSGSDVANIIHINDGGDAVCSTTFYIKGYDRDTWVERLKDATTDEDKVDELLAKVEVEYEIEAFSLLDDLENDRLRIDVVVQLPGFAALMDDVYFFSPFTWPVAENPFESDSRNFPVDFKYPYKNRVMIQASVPEDAKITEFPINVYKDINGAKFIRKSKGADNFVSIEARLEIRKPVFVPKEYERLKALFDAMTTSCLDQIAATTIGDTTVNR